jgi:hypothetical protein
VLAVKELKTFAITLARIMPLHVTTSSTLPKYVTEEQILARLREAGLPENIVEMMHPIDSRTLAPDEIGDPYNEVDEESMVDVTPDKEA